MNLTTLLFADEGFIATTSKCNVRQGCTNPGHQVARMATFSMVAPNILGSSIRNSFLSSFCHLEF
jgi:hypothetical protein